MRTMLIGVIAFLCLLSAKALAQGETTSAIVGEVRDATHALVPGAEVTITHRETGLTRKVKTDARGTLSISAITPRALLGAGQGSGFRAPAE